MHALIRYYHGDPFFKGPFFSHPIILRNSLLLLVFCVLLSIRFYILNLCSYSHSHDNCVCVCMCLHVHMCVCMCVRI